MEDKEIVSMYLSRSEAAIAETRKKYGRYCRATANRILANDEDTDQCENDAYLQLWNSIPPNKPENLATYLGKITRRLALNCRRRMKAKKRGEYELALDELAECLPGESGDFADNIALKDALNRFLGTLSQEALGIFMRRYWYFCAVKEIACELGCSESKVKMSLLRTREKLRDFLESEGITI